MINRVMHYQIWQRCLIAMSVLLAVVGNAVKASSRPASIFTPHMEEIQRNLPPGLVMRLPAEIRLGGASDIEESKLFVRVFSSDTPRTYTVSVSTCDRGPLPCLIGSFSVDRKTSASAMLEFQRHQAQGDPITLNKDVLGYLLEGPEQRPSYRFSSVMWEQDDMVYRVTFPAIERQNILFMAYSMSHQPPLYRVVPPRNPVPLYPRNPLFF